MKFEVNTQQHANTNQVVFTVTRPDDDIFPSVSLQMPRDIAEYIKKAIDAYESENRIVHLENASRIERDILLLKPNPMAAGFGAEDAVIYKKGYSDARLQAAMLVRRETE